MVRLSKEFYFRSAKIVKEAKKVAGGLKLFLYLRSYGLAGWGYIESRGVGSGEANLI